MRRRKIHVISQCLLLLAVVIPGAGQSKPAGVGKSPLCTRDNALEMIKQQVDLTKSFNNTTRRITVLIRALLE
jgi:hypothetical protein